MNVFLPQNATLFPRFSKGLTPHGIAEEADRAQPSFPLHWGGLSHCRGGLQEQSGNCVFHTGELLVDRRHLQVKMQCLDLNQLLIKVCFPASGFCLSLCLL